MTINAINTADWRTSRKARYGSTQTPSPARPECQTALWEEAAKNRYPPGQVHAAYPPSFNIRRNPRRPISRSLSKPVPRIDLHWKGTHQIERIGQRFHDARTGNEQVLHNLATRGRIRPFLGAGAFAQAVNHGTDHRFHGFKPVFQRCFHKRHTRRTRRGRAQQIAIHGAEPGIES